MVRQSNRPKNPLWKWTLRLHCAPWSKRSWNDLSGEETQNHFWIIDSFWFKNPILDFLKVPLRRNFTFLFSPLFLPRITYRHVRCPFVQKELNKKVSRIKISPFEKWNFSSAIAWKWFQLSPLFSQQHLHLWRHLPSTRLMIAWF